MARILAAVLLVAATCMMAGAQRKPQPGITAELRDDGWVWKLETRGEIDLHTMLRLYAQARDITLMYDARKLAGTTSWFSESREIAGVDIDLFVANALAEYRLVLVPIGADFYAIAPMAQAETSAPVLTRAEVESANPALWAAIPVQTRNFVWIKPRGAVVNLTTFEDDKLPYLHSGDTLCGRVDQLRNTLKILDILDADAARETMAHKLPAAVEAEAAAAELRQLFGAAATFAASPDGLHVLCRTRPALQQQVADSVAALK